MFNIDIPTKCKYQFLLTDKVQSQANKSIEKLQLDRSLIGKKFAIQGDTQFDFELDDPSFPNLDLTDPEQQQACFPAFKEKISQLRSEYVSESKKLTDGSLLPASPPAVSQVPVATQTESLSMSQQVTDSSSITEKEESLYKAKVDEAKLKGEEYAKKSSYIWELNTNRDPVSDKSTNTAFSNQKTSTTVAEISTKCSDDSAVLTVEVVLTDLNGKNNIHIINNSIVPVSSDGVNFVIKQRVNDEIKDLLSNSQYFNSFNVAHFARNKTLKKFRNSNEQISGNMSVEDKMRIAGDRIRLVTYNFGGGLYDADTTWRVAASLETNAGKIYVDVPLYSQNFRTALDACLK